MSATSKSLKNLSLVAKMTILGVLTTVMIAITGLMYFFEVGRSIHTSRDEVADIAPARDALQHLVQQQQRRTAPGLDGPSAELVGKLDQLADSSGLSIDRQFSNLVDATLVAVPRLINRLDQYAVTLATNPADAAALRGRIDDAREQFLSDARKALGDNPAQKTALAEGVARADQAMVQLLSAEPPATARREATEALAGFALAGLDHLETTITARADRLALERWIITVLIVLGGAALLGARTWVVMGVREEMGEALTDVRGQVAAMARSQAVIEFGLDGKIRSANDNFLATMGYAADEIIGQHHRIFVEPAEAASVEYRQFWDDLAAGEFRAGKYKRIGKNGKEVWIQASYNPIFDTQGKPFKVVKYASDISAQQLQSANYEGQLAAIGKAQAIIEFSLDGRILSANENFLTTMGYTLVEVLGQHHSMFVLVAERQSDDYRRFWEKLGRGEYDAGQYKRLGRHGKEIWIQASYNPILDMNGRPFKVVKYATDITAAKLMEADVTGQLAAIGKSQAVIEFSLDGTILNANDNFCEVTGYSLREIKGQHHGMFVDPTYRASHEYRVFWDKLGRGEYDEGQYRRITKSGKEVWIQASYNPIFDMNGKPFKVVKYATDISDAKLAAANYEGQIAAIGKSQAVIEFDMKGNIISANDNFLQALGYSLDELRGQHHRLFVDPTESLGTEYRLFWEKLGRGEYDAGQYKRFAKGGREVWIQASYNPILDMSGRPFKVVKYATDITAAKLKAADYEGQLTAISQAQGIIEFKLDGTILNANENFLNTVGYRLEDIQGRHHSVFVDRATRDSAEYRLFWEKLGRGEYDHGQYRRVGKDGREVFIQASYNPILDMNGKPFKVVKYCTNVGEQVRAAKQLELAVRQTQEVVMAAKDGDLVGRIPMEGKDGSIADLCSGVNAVLDSMSAVVGNIKAASEAINTAAKEIASGNTDLSARTEQQAASLEETASSMEELTSTVKQNAENAKQANQLAIGASDVALKGGQVVNSVVTTMSQISEASKKIADIIGVIDGIAFQTNILALNAAVEAARAGEQGRGFAVVAAEVRSLAQRSASAAKEIKSLIGDSVEKVGNGSKLVEQAGKTMDEIVHSVKRVTDIMSEITAASQEQSQGIEQINHTVTQMDEMTQQNAALVEEASAAARSLEEQAGGLTESVAGYRLASDAAAPVVATSTLPAARHLRPALKSVRSHPAVAAKASAPVRRAVPAALPKASGGDGQWTEF